ncbi:MAG: hypothetical protein QM775_35865 [Pirellulales bacterium]
MRRGGRPQPVGATIPGIRDDEIERRLTAMRDRGAFVFFLADTCHSGTLTRGPAEEDAGTTARHVPTEDFLTPDELRDAKSKAKHADHARQEVPPTATSRGGLAAIYAVPPTAVEQEQPMPPPDARRDAPRYGRLTYTLHHVLAQSEAPLTYRELAQQIAWQYRRWDFLPFPLLEGSALDREVLGKREWQDRSSLVLTRDEAGALMLNQGATHGLTVGSLLRVLPPIGAGESGDSLGQVVVREVLPFTARCEPSKTNAVSDSQVESWPNPARCELVARGQSVDVARVRVREQATGAKNAIKESAGHLRVLLQLVSAPYRLAKADETADLYLDVGPANVTLHTGTSYDQAAPSYSWSPVDEALPDRLADELHRAATARNLLRLAAPEAPKEGKFQSGEVGLAIDLERATSPQGPWTPIDDVAPPRLTRGDLLRVTLRNVGVSRLDATVLYVDAASQIQSLYPTFRAAQAGAYNTIAPQQSQEVVVRINDSTVGLEDVLVLAVPHVPPLAAHFAFLQQPGLTTADLQRHRGAAGSPLDALLSQSLGGTRTRRA